MSLLKKYFRCKNCTEELSGDFTKDFIEISRNLLLCYGCIRDILKDEKRAQDEKDLTPFQIELRERRDHLNKLFKEEKYK